MKTLTILFCFILSQLSFGAAADESNLSTQSYERAREVLWSGIQALGGMENLKLFGILMSRTRSSILLEDRT
ncbi:hypothetical protein IIA29_12950 [candidate division KSB1 bacterium]|nr:hypothetical protein [candidate division KSB1 bacterium]